MKIKDILIESVIPHPQFGHFKKAGKNLRPNNKNKRIEIVFDGVRNNPYHVHIAGTDVGEKFVWVTQGETGGMEEYRSFKTITKMLAYVKGRFGIKLDSWGKITRLNTSTKMDKFQRKQMGE